MKPHRRLKCGRCNGHGVVANYDMGGFLSPDECPDCGGSGTIVQYRNGSLASYYGGPMLGYDKPEIDGGPLVNALTLTALLPCPFCGGRADVYRIPDALYGVQCECAARTSEALTKAEAIAAWNRRTPVTEPVEG